MKTKLKLFLAWLFCAVALGIGSPFTLAAAAEDWADTAPAKTSEAIAWSQIGAKAGADYKGDHLAVTPTENGARLSCVFQRLEGEATSEGLWLTSTVEGKHGDRFPMAASAFGRDSRRNFIPMPVTGMVEVADKLVRFTRPGLVEEYSVSMDGVRQDFVVLGRPEGTGELQMRQS